MLVVKKWSRRAPMELSANDMVHVRMQDREYGDAPIEQLAARVDALADIVSRLIEHLPADQWLEITGLEHTYEKAD